MSSKFAAVSVAVFSVGACGGSGDRTSATSTSAASTTTSDPVALFVSAVQKKLTGDTGMYANKSEPSLRQIGTDVCDGLRKGSDSREVAVALRTQTDFEATGEQVLVVMGLAVTTLCPEMRSKVAADFGP